VKVYKPEAAAHGKTQTLIVSPGTDHPENSDWWEETRGAEGETVKKPKMFLIKFVNGVADVERTLGQYLLDKNLVARSAILLPGAGVVAA
jgi:hypothetical protein